MSDRRYGADEHNTDYERGREDERAAIVAWLRERALLRWGDAVDYAADIESGQHLRARNG